MARKQADLKRKAQAVAEAEAAKRGGKRQKGWWEEPAERGEGEGGAGQDEDDDVDWYRREVRWSLSLQRAIVVYQQCAASNCGASGMCTMGTRAGGSAGCHGARDWVQLRKLALHCECAGRVGFAEHPAPNPCLAAGGRGARGYSRAEERQQGRRWRPGQRPRPRRRPWRRPFRRPAARAAGRRRRERQGRAWRQGRRRAQNDCAGQGGSWLWRRQEAEVLKMMNWAQNVPGLSAPVVFCLIEGRMLAAMLHAHERTGCDAHLVQDTESVDRAAQSVRTMGVEKRQGTGLKDSYTEVRGACRSYSFEIWREEGRSSAKDAGESRKPCRRRANRCGRQENQTNREQRENGWFERRIKAMQATCRQVWAEAKSKRTAQRREWAVSGDTYERPGL